MPCNPLSPSTSSEKQGAWANEARLHGQLSLPLLAVHFLSYFEDELGQRMVISSRHCFLSRLWFLRECQSDLVASAHGFTGRLFRARKLIHQKLGTSAANQKRQATCGRVCEDQSWLDSQVHRLKLGASFSFRERRVGLITYYFTQSEQDFVQFPFKFLTELWVATISWPHSGMPDVDSVFFSFRLYKGENLC